MHGCQSCQDQLLDFLYDLLDEAESQALRDHLAGCAACQAALEEARGQQKLLAAAARAHFPHVQFTPPSEQTTVKPAGSGVRPVLLPTRPRLHKPARWQPWAIAAAVLVAVAGLGIPGAVARRNYVAAERVLRDKEAAVADARTTLRAAQEEMVAAAHQRDQRVNEIRHAVRGRELRMEVQGPHTIQAGAPAEFFVRTFDLNNQPAPADVSASLTGMPKPGEKNPDVERNGKESMEGTRAADATSQGPTVREVETGLYKVSIPASLRLDMGRPVGMTVAARRKDDKRQVSLSGTLRLTAPVYLTHLTTDKPMYQPGETVRFRSLSVDRATLRPAGEDFRLVYSLSMPSGALKTSVRGGNGIVRLDNKGELHPVNGPDNKPIRGVGAGEFVLEDDSPGGEWTLTVNEEYGRFPAVTRKFIVNRYQKPRLDKKLDFNKSSYGEGAEVQARVIARLADGGPLKNRPVEINVTVDDQLVDSNGRVSGKSFAARTDDEGVVVARFKLPAKIERGQATLAVTFLDTGLTDTIVRPIPVVLKKLAVEFFPEGGDLIAGLDNRVYFQARTPLGKPAQVTATLLENGQPLPGVIETLSDDVDPGVNQGHGVFSLTPRKGSTYSLRIDAPAGITQRFDLPAPREDGVVLRVPSGVFAADDPLRAVVLGGGSRTLLVGAYCRGRLLDIVRLEKGQSEAVLKPTSGAGGVCRITVFEELPGQGVQRQLRPLAERLVYRHPKERVDIAIVADQKNYVPGQKVNLSVSTTNEKEQPTPAIVMFAVVDKSVTTLADEKTYRTMPTHLLLTTEVQRADDLEYADFLVGQHPKAPRALDLLLGTQGWRRFAEQSPEQFRDRLAREARTMPEAQRKLLEEEAERLLVLIGQSSPKTTDFDQQEIDRALGEFDATAETLQAKHDEAAAAIGAAGEDAVYRSALARVRWYQDTAQRGREVAIPILGVALMVLVLMALVQFARKQVRLAGITTGLGIACVLLLLAAWRLPLGMALPDELTPNREFAQLDVPAPERTKVWDIEPLRDALGDAKDKDKGDAAFNPGAPGGGLGMGGLGGAGGMPAPQPGLAGGGAAMARPAGGPPAKMLFGKGGRPGMGGFGGGDDAAKKDAPAMAYMLAGDQKKKAAGIVLREQALKEDGKRRMEAGKPPPGSGGRGGKGAEDRREGLDMARQKMFGRGEGKDMDRDMKGKGEPGYIPMPPFVVREYAHARGTSPASVRSDFAETLAWHPVLVLPQGKTEVSFELCDSVTTFEALAYAHTLDGRLGAVKKAIEARLPFTLSPKVPVEVTATDRIDIPLGIANNTSEKREVQVQLTGHDGLKLVEGEREVKRELPGDGRTRQVFSFRPSLVEGKATLRFEGKCGPFSDGIQETVRVVPDGFPITGSASDLLEKSATHKVKLPATWIAGTLKVRVDVYPSTLADLQKGLEGLLGEPHGCFEQSSTTNYPNVLILDYLRTADKADPQLEKRVRELLERGYRKLTSYECQESGGNKRRGYEWFGGTAPPHEALTAYGLLQFRDMAKVHEVDAAMLKRTKDYLLGQRDGKGGFTRNARALDTFGRAPDHITNAYIVWALSEAVADEDLSKELEALQKKESDDPYYLALVALALANRGKTTEAEALLKQVAKKQKEAGHLDAMETSITGSGGVSLQIETTALAVLGWLKTNPAVFDANIRSAVKWIGQQRGGQGAFGSTQSTILALKALIAHAKANKRTPEAGELRLYVGETKVADLPFPAGVNQPLTLELPEAEKYLKAGDNTIRVEITGAKNVFPHTLGWSYRTTKPNSAAKVPVKLSTSLAKKELAEGESVRLSVRVENATNAGQGMAVAIVGLPAGLNLPEDLKQLKEYCRLSDDGKRPLLSAFEVTGRELVLYWRDLAKGEKIEVPVDVVARVPGEYRGPASRAYLYYNAEAKDWVEPLGVTVKAR